MIKITFIFDFFNFIDYLYIYLLVNKVINTIRSPWKNCNFENMLHARPCEIRANRQKCSTCICITIRDLIIIESLVRLYNLGSFRKFQNNFDNIRKTINCCLGGNYSINCFSRLQIIADYFKSNVSTLRAEYFSFSQLLLWIPRLIFKLKVFF